MKSKINKTTTITQLRNVLYEQIDLVRSGNYEYKKANSISQAAAGIFQSYKLQLQALSLSGKKNEAEKLTGILD